MDNMLSQRMAKLQPTLSAFLDFFNDPEFGARLDNPRACDFALGNPHEMPLPGFVSALQKALPPQNKDWFAYKLNEDSSRQAVAESLSRLRGVSYRPQDIYLTNGAFAALSVCLDAVVDTGDEVIFISPPWFFYEAMIVNAGGTPVRVKIDPQSFDLNLDAIAAAMTPRTRAIIINSPQNPTGKMYPAETLRRLGDLLTDASNRSGRPIFLLSDESYSRILFDGRTYISPTGFYPASFLIYTYGKTVLTPGQRIGYIALGPDFPQKEAMANILLTAQLLTGYAFPNALLQHAITDLEKLSIDIRHIEEKRDWMTAALGEMGYSLHSPEGTFYLLPRSPIEDDLAFNRILREQDIYCLPGTIVEMPGYFRISLTANDSMIERGLPGFQAALEKSRKMVSV